MPTAADVRHVVQERTPTWTGAQPVLFRSSWKTTLVSCHAQGEAFGLQSLQPLFNPFEYFTDLEESF